MSGACPTCGQATDFGASFAPLGAAIEPLEPMTEARRKELVAETVQKIREAEGSLLPFQARVAPWMQECFGPVISADRLERGDRLLEEVLELLQSGGYPMHRIATLRDYVYSRPPGEPDQEAGGTMVTLAAYCQAHDLDMHRAGERELARILEPEVMAKIRAKQAAKAAAIGASPLPAAPARLRVVNTEGALVTPELQYRFTWEDCDALRDMMYRICGELEGAFFGVEIRNDGLDLGLMIGATILRPGETEHWSSLYIWTFDCSTEELKVAAREQFDSFATREAFLEALAAEYAPKLVEKWRHETGASA